MEQNARTMGTVQWFSRVKGYGFVRPDGQEEDVFVHYSAIQGEGYRNLNKGQRVEFAVEDTPKGPQAVDVVELGVEVELDMGEVGLDTGEVELDIGEVELDIGEGESAEVAI